MDSDSRSCMSQPTIAKTRTLTPLQRERKRAADRKAHRQSREKTKSYIAHLERLLDETAISSIATDADANETFLSRLKHDFDEMDRLKKSLATICEVAQAALEDTTASTSTKSRNAIALNRPMSASAATVSDTSPGDKARSGTARQFHEEGNGNEETPVEVFSAELSDSFSSSSPFAQFSGGLDSTSTDLTILDIPFESTKNNATGGGWEKNAHMAVIDYHHSPRTIWTLLGQFTCSALQSPAAAAAPTIIAPDLARDTDILVRAVLHGWDVTAGDHWLDMTWQTLKQTDQQLLSGYHNPAERLAMLYVMRLQLHHIITGQYLPGTPSFLHARPSQKLINHPPHAAYYVWPGFREHLLVWPDRYSSDNLLEHLRSNFRFLWPYESHDLYVWDRYTGKYSFSTDFSQRIEDIRCWTVHPGFFTLYPELQNEIPVFNSRPSFIFPPGSGNFALSLLTPATAAVHDLYSSDDATTPQSDSHAASWQLPPGSTAMFRM